MDTKKIANKVAKEKGYDHSTFQIQWKEYDAYSAEFDGKEDMIVGLPIFILVDKYGKDHIASEKGWIDFSKLL